MSDFEFEITEEIIQKTINYLKYHDPENATREKAIAMLEDLKEGYRGIGQKDPRKLDELKKVLDQD